MPSFPMLQSMLLIMNLFLFLFHTTNQPSHPNMKSKVPASAATLPILADNPLLSPWEGPYGGIPPFDRIQVAHFKPALEAAMEEKLAEMENIASNSAAPDFKNTIEAMEAAGKTLTRVKSIYSIWSSNMSTKEFQAVEAEM